jgi:hypothetical protein
LLVERLDGRGRAPGGKLAAQVGGALGDRADALLGWWVASATAASRHASSISFCWMWVEANAISTMDRALRWPRPCTCSACRRTGCAASASPSVARLVPS